MTFNLTSQRSAATEVAFSLGGLVNMRFDLVAQARTGKTKDASFKLMCPADHDHVVAVKQGYTCDEDPTHGPFQISDMPNRCREADNGVLVVADPDEITAAKVGDMVKGAIELSVCPAAQVNAACRPSSKGYRLRPARSKGVMAPKEVELYAVLRDLVASRPDLAFVGELRIRDSRNLYMLQVWGEGPTATLMLAELALPADLSDTDDIDLPTNEANVAKLGKLADTFVEDFDPENFRFDVAAAVAELVASKTGADTGAPKVAAKVAPVIDLDSFLDEALAKAAAA